MRSCMQRICVSKSKYTILHACILTHIFIEVIIVLVQNVHFSMHAFPHVNDIWVSKIKVRFCTHMHSHMRFYIRKIVLVLNARFPMHAFPHAYDVCVSEHKCAFLHECVSTRIFREGIWDDCSITLCHRPWYWRDSYTFPLMDLSVHLLFY